MHKTNDRYETVKLAGWDRVLEWSDESASASRRHVDALSALLFTQTPLARTHRAEQVHVGLRDVIGAVLTDVSSRALSTVRLRVQVRAGEVGGVVGRAETVQLAVVRVRLGVQVDVITFRCWHSSMPLPARRHSKGCFY